MVIDPALKQWATDRQAEYVDAVNEHGSGGRAAEALGVSKSSVNESLQLLKKKAAAQGYSPDENMIHAAPDPFIVKGVSTLYGEDGTVKAQWVKSAIDREQFEAIKQEALEALAQDLPRLPPIDPPTQTVSNLCNVYTMTDCHMGMLAWHKEGGADWDVKIAERVLTGCFERMVASSQPSSKCIVNQLGDFLHSDGLLPVTPTSGHILDQDGRFSKIVGATIRVLRRLIDMALLKHDEVVVIMAEGNHDMASSVWLRHMFKALYENEPRVRVDDSELPYYAHQFGKTMLCFAHGHMKKIDRLPLAFASMFPEMWGATTKRYCHGGHNHHAYMKEHSGMKVVQHPTLAAPDAYASRHALMSERQASSITYHKEFGQVAQVTVTPEMLEG